MTPAQTYDLKNRVWQQWSQRQRSTLAAAYPGTNGIELYVHNWIVCGNDRDASTAAQSLIDTTWAHWRRLAARLDRWYAQAEHRTHRAHFRPLWCTYCV